MRGKKRPALLCLLLFFFFALFFTCGCSTVAHIDAKLWPPFMSLGFGRSPGGVNSVVEADFVPPRLSLGFGPFFGETRDNIPPYKEEVIDDKLDSLERRVDRLERRAD